MDTDTASTYMLVFHEPSRAVYESMSPEALEEALRTWNAWCDELVAKGKLRSGNTLAPEGRVVKESGTGSRVDGPFAEAKELIGGFFLVKAADLDEATEIAEQCPNLPQGMTVEVRPVAQVCYLARSLGWESMRGPKAAAAT